MSSIIPQIVINSLIAGSIYAILGLGFALIYRTVKFFDLGYGALTAVGGYMVFLFFKQLGFGLVPTIILSLAISGFVGWLIYKLVYIPLRNRKASNMVLLVASLGVFTALQAIIAILFTSRFQTLVTNVSVQPVYEIAGGFITQTQVIILICAALVGVGLLWLTRRTLTGKAITAISDDEEVSKIVGINTEKVIGLVFFIGSAIAGLAGILVGFDTGIEPTMGMSLLLKGVIAVIIGGIGSLHGAIIGAFLLAFVENIAVWQLSGEWKEAVAFSVLILFLLFRPKGIVNK